MIQRIIRNLNIVLRDLEDRYYLLYREVKKIKSYKMRIRINKVDLKPPFVLGETENNIQLAGIAANLQCLFEENAFCPSQNTVGLWNSLS